MFIYNVRDNDKATSKPNKNDDDELSSEMYPVISSTVDKNFTDQYLPANNNKTRNINVHLNSARERSEISSINISNNPWIPRCNRPLSDQITYNREQQRKSAQYESHPYYRSLSFISYDCFLQRQQQRQPLFSTVDKDIEYVESRLRGETINSPPTAHLTDHTNDLTWRQPYSNVLTTSSSMDNHQQIFHVHQEHLNTTNKQQINGTVRSARSTTSTQQSRKTDNARTVKRRTEKMKDQKAAKTLRSIQIDFGKISPLHFFFTVRF